MEYNRSTAKEKWTLMMYMRDFDLMTTYAYALRTFSNKLTSENIDEILQKMEDDNIYHPRNGGSTFTGQFKSIQIAWYMFGYYNKSCKPNEEKKMVFSPLGNLLLDNITDKKKCAKIFLAMLFGNGFRQPFSRMSEDFNIYAYRLIFQLLRDPRLKGRLYNDEVFYLTMFLKVIDQDTYEELISDILNLRALSATSKFKLFKENEKILGLACHEWRYAIGMLESARIININNDNNNIIVGQLTYGNINPKTGKPNAIRNYKEDYITLRPELFKFTDILLENYPYYNRPYTDEDKSQKFNSSIIVEMYSFYPPELLAEIGITSQKDKAITEMLDMANNINYYSHEETAGGVNFEYAINDAFNMLSDVEAERIAGAGNPDIECLYYPKAGDNIKFDIEAKARKTKLLEINSRRIRTHRDLIKSNYTMIVAPNYTIGVLKDIEGEKSVIVKSATLANYFYQSILKNGRNISYAALNEIIILHMGRDITNVLDTYVYDNFGHNISDLSISKNKNKNKDTTYIKEHPKVAETMKPYNSHN